MLGLDVLGEISIFAEGLIALRTLVRLLTKVDTFDMSLEVTILRKFLRTNLTAERLLLGVGSDVSLEFRGFGKYFLTILTDLVLSHGNISFLSFRKVVSILVRTISISIFVLFIFLSLSDVRAVHVL